MTIAWPLYLASLCALILSHALLSAPSVRPWLIACLGKPTFIAVHSAFSIAALIAVIWAYRAIESNPLLWMAPSWAPIGVIAVMPIAFFLVIARLTTKPGDHPHGIYRVTRAPGSLGILVWAGLHLIATGDLKRVALFAAMGAIAVIAIAKNERATAQSWRASTSLIPFRAIARRRQDWRPSEIGVWRVAGAAILTIMILLGHDAVLGVDPLAGWR